MKNFDYVTLGTDPEFGAGRVVDGVLQVVPAAYFRTELNMPHLEDPQHPVYYQKDGIKVIEDGVAFELNVPPSRGGNWHALLSNVHFGIEIIDKLLRNFRAETVGPTIRPALPYDFEYWNKLGDNMIMANMFGCDPDIDAFNTEYNGEIIQADTHPWRYFGGHLHFSGLPVFRSEPRLSIKAMAMGPGLAATAYSPHPELERKRTFLYGKVGKFRIQHYSNNAIGVEYRTPSNSWTDPDNTELASQIFHWAEFAVNVLLSDLSKLSTLADELQADMTAAIAQCDQPKALALLAYIESKY